MGEKLTMVVTLFQENLLILSQDNEVYNIMVITLDV